MRAYADSSVEMLVNSLSNDADSPRFFRNSKYFSAETSFCWAFSISTMIRHSLNLFLRQKANKQSNQDEKQKVVEALQFLNHHDFHKRLRNGCNNYTTYVLSSSFP